MEKTNYEETLFYRESTEDELEDLKMYNVGSVVQIDSGATLTSVNNSIDLTNPRKV